MDPSRRDRYRAEARAARRWALGRLAAQVGDVSAALGLTSERVGRVTAAEAAAGGYHRLSPVQRTEMRNARWELRRLEAELHRLREEFERLRTSAPSS